MRPARLTAILFVVAALAATVVYAAFQIASPEPQLSLATYAPPGALMALESPDFAALLHSWNSSAEQRRWVAGDDYAAFSRSRLFGRLNEAQSQFAIAAGLAPDSHFLEQIAGTDSLFAWYDIGNLEFVYITRVAKEQADNMPLLALRGKFEQREAGGVTFYVRTTGAEAGGASGSANSDDARPRTVAFAVRGDLLVLATREDLMAGALEQMAHPGDRSLAGDFWYASSVAAANEKPGDLRLTLNLAAITRSPYFRSYWVQQNVTATRRYTAALSDLYREVGNFREERFLLPGTAQQTSADADLTAVLRFLPAGVVYRAVAHPSATNAMAELQEKLLARTAAILPNEHEAPSAGLTVPTAGSASDLDDRIDTPKAPTDSEAVALAELRSLLNDHATIAMLSFSDAHGADSQASAEPSRRDSMFRTIHSGVALATGRSCDVSAWQQALTAALAPRVSVGNTGLGWHEERNGKVRWFKLDGRFPLVFAAEGNTCLVATDPATMQAMISGAGAALAHETSASKIAGFSHAAQRGPLVELARLLDHRSREDNDARQDGNRPPFFSGNMVSLSNTFEDVDSETFTEFQASPTLTRQTVTYVLDHK